MAQLEKFEDFESAVSDKVKEKIGYSDAALVGAGVISGFFPIIGALINGAFMGSTVGLAERAFRSYIQAAYRRRFEDHKNDNEYINKLVDEAADDMIKRNS